MAYGLSTGSMFDPMFRNPLQSNAESGLYTADYEAKSQVGPTRENLAKKQHAEDIKNLSAEIAAKETPQAKKEREESGFFSRSAQESALEEQKASLQKKVEENALEEAVKLDKYFLIKSEWDRKVIKAANGEEVTVEIDDKDAKKNADGTYPKKIITITKSSKLRKISNERPKPTGKTASMVKDEYSDKREALRDKYSAGWFTDTEEAREEHKIVFDDEKIVGGDPLAIEEYKAELGKLNDAEQKELTSIANKAASAPAPQGLNVEPHTIAIYAPGFCMNKGCCLEHAFYTLRTAAKTIEDDAEALVEKDLSDVIEENRNLHTQLEDMQKEHKKIYEEAQKKAQELATEDYKTAYQLYLQVNTGPDGNPVNAGPKPDPKQYTAQIYLDRNPDLLSDYYDHENEILMMEDTIALSDYELEEQKAEAMKKLTTEAVNYRLLLERCTFQPTCPEWLEDVGTGIADAAKATGEAIVNAAEWCWDGISSAADWVAEGGIGRTIDTVNGYINDGLAFMSDLQTQLNELVGFEGICSLNPFGGTLGCANCPMGSKCASDKAGLLDKLKIAGTTNDFLKNLKGALGLGNGQILGNLLQCAAALTGEVSGAISAVESFAIGTGAAKVLGGTADILNTSKLPHWNTKVADCISMGTTLDQAKDAMDLINNTGNNPMSVMSSNVPGIGTSALDISKLDSVSAGTSHFAVMALGNDTHNAVENAKKALPVEKPSGSTKYYDGKNVDIDSATKQMKKMAAAGMAYA